MFIWISQYKTITTARETAVSLFCLSNYRVESCFTGLYKSLKTLTQVKTNREIGERAAPSVPDLEIKSNYFNARACSKTTLNLPTKWGILKLHCFMKTANWWGRHGLLITFGYWEIIESQQAAVVLRQHVAQSVGELSSPGLILAWVVTCELVVWLQGWRVTTSASGIGVT